MSVKATMRKATRAVTKAFTPDPGPVEQTDILDTLKKEHDEVKDLLEALQEAGTPGQRRRLVQQIKAALVPHTKAEEKVVYDRVINLRDKEAQTNGHEGYLEHEWAGKTLQRMEKIENSSSAEHLAAGKVLKELVEHHIREEERNVWSDVRENFSEDERYRMNVEFEAAKARVRV